MKSVMLMAFVCGASLLAVSAAGGSVEPAIVAGMAGPFLAAAVSWLAVERTFRANPAGVSSLMMTAFLVKILFFGVYVVAALKIAGLPPRPFAVSFTCYFVALHVIEALMFRRLFSSGAARPVSS